MFSSAARLNSDVDDHFVVWLLHGLAEAVPFPTGAASRGFRVRERCGSGAGARTRARRPSANCKTPSLDRQGLVQMALLAQDLRCQACAAALPSIDLRKNMEELPEPVLPAFQAAFTVEALTSSQWRR